MDSGLACCIGLLTYFVDSGLLKVVQNRGNRIGNFLLRQVKHMARAHTIPEDTAGRHA
jgi:hypothetical protein